MKQYFVIKKRIKWSDYPSLSYGFATYVRLVFILFIAYLSFAFRNMFYADRFFTVFRLFLFRSHWKGFFGQKIMFLHWKFTKRIAFYYENKYLFGSSWESNFPQTKMIIDFLILYFLHMQIVHQRIQQKMHRRRQAHQHQ